MIYGFFILTLFYVIGMLVSQLINGWIPGSVMGMLLLFIALLLKVVNPEKIKKASQGMTKHMALFFVPVGVGLMASVHLILPYLTSIVVASIVSTLLVLATVAFIQQRFETWR